MKDVGTRGEVDPDDSAAGVGRAIDPAGTLCCCRLIPACALALPARWSSPPCAPPPICLGPFISATTSASVRSLSLPPSSSDSEEEGDAPRGGASVDPVADLDVGAGGRTERDVGTGGRAMLPDAGAAGMGDATVAVGADDATVEVGPATSASLVMTSPLPSFATTLPSFASSSLLACVRAALCMIAKSQGCSAAVAFTR